jgi:hypothetical protein
MKIIMKKTKLKKEKTPTPVVTHDFTMSFWGHAIHWGFGERKEDGTQHVMGHSTPQPHDGDELLVKMKSGKVAVYKCANVEYMRDPEDMWEADITPVRYKDEEAESTAHE